MALTTPPQQSAPIPPRAGVAAPLESPQDLDGIDLREIWMGVRRRRRLVLVVAATMFTLSTGVVLLRRVLAPTYAGGFQLLISDPISSATGNSTDGGAVESLARNRTSVDTPTLILTLSSRLVLDPVRRELGSEAALLDSLEIQKGAIAAKGAGEVQGVLLVNLKGRDPGELKRGLDAVSKAYLAFSLSQRRDRLNQGLRFLDQQEPLLEARVNRLQSDLADFRRRHNLLAPETQATDIKSETLSMAQQERQVMAERTRLLKLRQEIAAGRLTAANFTSRDQGSAGSTDSVTVTQARRDLLDQLQTVEQQLAQARSTYRADSPRVETLEQLRNRLAEQLRSQQIQAVDTALALNNTRSATLRQQVKELDRRFLEQPRLIKDYQDLTQQLDVARTNLDNFLSTRSTFQLEQAQNTVPWKLLSPPSVNGYPEEPSLRKGVLLSLLLAGSAGIAAGVLRDRFDHVFHSALEVREQLDEPLLGHIPHVAAFQGVREDSRFLLQELDGQGPELASSSSAAVSLRRYQLFFYQEAFRNLFTSLRFLNTGSQLRSIALTSSLPVEGKTLVNILLAKTLSEMGQRVLLVDADLRKPQVHTRLGLNNLTGLSNLLTEPELAWSDVIQTVEGYPGWSVLTAGLRPPDPARLLGSSRMEQLVQNFADSDSFDLVLYDTPPVLGMADAALVAQHLDGVMLLVSLKRVDRSLPAEAIARIRSSGATLLGLVTNAVREESTKREAYGYGSGRYGLGRYGYGAYDPRNIYASYNEAEGDGGPADATKPEQKALSPLHRLRTTADGLRRWIEG